MRHAALAAFFRLLDRHLLTHIRTHIFRTIGKTTALSKALKSCNFPSCSLRFTSKISGSGGETGIRTLGTREGSTVFETVFGLFGCAEVLILLASKRPRGGKLASSAGQGGIVGRHSASSLPSRWEAMRGRNVSLMAGDHSPGSSRACCGWLGSTGRWPTSAPCPGVRRPWTWPSRIVASRGC